MRRLVVGVVVLLAGVSFAQNRPTPNSNQARIFITDSKSWELSGGFGGTEGGFGGGQTGGARPQTAEIIKTFGQRCPTVIVNNKRERADYIVLLDHEGGKSPFLRDNKIAVFNHDGDSILSNSTRSLGNAVKDACDAIANDWRIHGTAVRAAQAAEPADPKSALTPAPVTPPTAVSRITVVSNPVAADIEIDGAFVGNTPSSIELSPGDHTIAVVKTGYKPWERKIKFIGGNINIDAELEPNLN